MLAVNPIPSSEAGAGSGVGVAVGGVVGVGRGATVGVGSGVGEGFIAGVDVGVEEWLEPVGVATFGPLSHPDAGTTAIRQSSPMLRMTEPMLMDAQNKSC
ncbi:MAG: hypothetical protein OXL97_00700 [Chloroflexota bacterium]|nr:hypothetical protein [Chloroflexota bacterium]MDE2883662.1 hypothetical protein [Chloroflexota bacterium]